MKDTLNFEPHGTGGACGYGWRGVSRGPGGSPEACLAPKYKSKALRDTIYHLLLNNNGVCEKCVLSILSIYNSSVAVGAIKLKR